MDDLCCKSLKKFNAGEFLYREFCNHVYLGQWELARACALSLVRYQVPETHKERLKQTLRDLSERPSLAKKSWSAFPSPSYVAYLSSRLLLQICEDEEGSHDVTDLQRLSEFDIMLEDIFPECSQSQIIELSSIHRTAVQRNFEPFKDENIELSGEMMTMIHELLLQNPPVISHFLNELCFSNDLEDFHQVKDEICDIYFLCVTHFLEQASSSSVKLDSKVFSELSLKIYWFLSLLPEHILKQTSGGRLQLKLDEIFLSVLYLCRSGVLKLEDVYSALIRRKRPSLLQYFCLKEDSYSASSKDSCTPFLKCVSDGVVMDMRDALLWSLKTNHHFLGSILDYCTKQLLIGSYSKIQNLLNQPLFSRLKPLVFILSCNACTDDISFSRVVEAMKLWHPTADDDISLVETCKKFLTNISFKEHCIDYYSKQFPHAGRNEVMSEASNIFNMAQTQSPLFVLQKVFGLKNIVPRLVLELLDSSSSDSDDSKVSSESSVVCLTAARDKIVYCGYLVITLVMDAILFCYEINQVIERKNYSICNILYKRKVHAEDGQHVAEEEKSCGNIVNKMWYDQIKEYLCEYGIQDAYSKFVVERLEKAKEEINSLHPIAFRIEILENLFSLLFLSSDDLLDISSCSDSDEGHEGDEKYSLPLQSNNNSSDKTGSTGRSHCGLLKESLPALEQCSGHEDAISKSAQGEERNIGRFIKSQVKIKEPHEMKGEPSEGYSGHGSALSTGSNSSSVLTANGFLCNELLLRDLLPILKDAIVSANAEIFKSRKKLDLDTKHRTYSIEPVTSVQVDELLERTSELKQCITEAQWRFELVRSTALSVLPHSSMKKAFKHSTSTEEFLFNSLVQSGNDFGSTAMSGTDVNGSDSSTKRRKRKRKRKHSVNSRVYSERNSAETNIIPRMLSSPCALLRYCLWSQNHEKAAKVIDLCKLHSSLEAEELAFSEGLTKLCDKLKRSIEVREKSLKSSSLGTKRTSAMPDIVAIANAAAFGLQSTAASSVIDREVSQIKIPEIPGVLEKFNQLPMPEKNLLAGAENFASITLADLVYSHGLLLQPSAVILEAAIQQWKDISFKKKDSLHSKKSESFIRGSLKSMQIILALIHCFQSFFIDNDTQSKLQSIFFPSLADSFSFSSCLVNYFGPVDSLNFAKYLQTWRTFSCQVEEVICLLQEEGRTNNDASECDFNTGEFNTRNELHLLYSKLEKAVADLCGWSLDTVNPRPSKYRSYLKKVYSYLKEVTSALLCCKDQNIVSGLNLYTSYFSVLKESPSEIFTKVIVQKKIPPQKLEKFAVSMKVDLPQVLLDKFFPQVPLFRESMDSQFCYHTSSVSVPLDHPCIILNKSANTWPTPRHPVIAAQELLKDFISIAQDVIIAKDTDGVLVSEDLLSLLNHTGLLSWMEECSELGYVDLDLLKSSDESFAFFVNVTNIAWVHALLLHGQSQFEDGDRKGTFNGMEHELTLTPIASPLLFQRLAWQKICGYSIGQLGEISLFDLRYYILHSNFSLPKHLELPPYNELTCKTASVKPSWVKYALPAESRLLFLLCEDLLYSPKLQVMYSEIFADQLEEAVREYLNFSVKVDVDRKSVQLSQLLEMYALDFDSQQGMSSPQYEGLINWLLPFVNTPTAQSLQNLLSFNSRSSDENSVLPEGERLLPFEIHFEPLQLKPGLMLSYPSVDASKFHTTIPRDIQKPMLLLEPDILRYMKDKCFPISDLFFFSNGSEESGVVNTFPLWLYASDVPETTHPVTQLLKLYGKCTVESSNDNQLNTEPFFWLLSVLSPTLPKVFVEQKINECLEKEKWSDCISYIDIYSEYQNFVDPCFDLLRNVILQFMASQRTSSGNISDPWCWALSISDPINRAKTVLENVHDWPDQYCEKALKLCLSDDSVKNDSALCLRLKGKLKEIELYEKILSSSNSISEDYATIFNSWQDVAEYSIWDQPIVLNCIKSGQYHLITEWMELHVVDNAVKLTALAMQVVWYLRKEEPQVTEVYTVCKDLDVSECVHLSKIVLPELPAVDSKLCFINFLLEKELDYEDRVFFMNMALGLKMLKTVSLSRVENYYDLVNYPSLFLEQLLMNMEVKDAEKALNAVSEDLQSESFVELSLSPSSINQLLEMYASKALELPDLDNLSESAVSSTTVLDSDEIDVPEKHFVMPEKAPSKDQWIPDSRVRICQACGDQKFSMFFRRHHCRRCGRVVCFNCSQNSLIVDGYGEVRVRVCDDCYHQTLHDPISDRSSPFKSSSFDKRYRILSTIKVASRSSPSQLSADYSELKHRSSVVENSEMYYWVLTGNQEQDETARSEFCFDPAPSVSLCLSILKLHSNPRKCAQFMLNLCGVLIKKIQQKHSRISDVKFDYSLVVSIVRSFLVSAQMKYHQLLDHKGEALVDTYFRNLEIIKMLVNYNCTYLIPTENLIRIETVRKLRDSVVEEERMHLAIDLSTNFNLDKTGIWASWGLFCLQSGDWSTAREKFKQCLKLPADRSKRSQESSTLFNVINVLENSKHSGKEKGSAVVEMLSSLGQIKKGIFEIKPAQETFSESIKEECLYYLMTYGTHFSTVAFYQRHGLINEALNYIINQKCETDVFIDAVFMPLLKHAQLSVLQDQLTYIDVALSKWGTYLIATCRHLDRLGYKNVLYQMQLFMEDYIRAAKSSINFYLAPASSYAQLFKRYHHLHNAKKHFETYLRNSQGEENYKPRNKHIMSLPVKEVERNLKTIKLQEEIARYFEVCESQNLQILHSEKNMYDEKDQLVGSLCPSTLFGSRNRKAEVVKMVLINAVKIDDGFDLAAKITKEYNLDPTTVSSMAGQGLVTLQLSEQVPHFLNCVKCCFRGEINADEVIFDCISSIITQDGDAEFLIKLLTSDSKKISAYLMCGKLKSAYLLAIKLSRTVDVHRIMVAAEQNGQEAIKQRCEKWLKANLQKQLPE